MIVDPLQHHAWLDQLNQHDTIVLRHQKSRIQKAILELFNKTDPGERRAELLRFWLRLNYTLTTRPTGTTMSTTTALSEEYQEEIYEYSFSLVAVISGIFVFITLAATVGVIVFCTRRRSVFTSGRSKRSTSRNTMNSYEMTDASLTDVEFTDYETETEVDEPHSVISFIQESDYEDETPLVSPSSEIPHVAPTSATRYGSTYTAYTDTMADSFFDPGPSTSGVSSSSSTSANIKKSQSYHGRINGRCSPQLGDESEDETDTIQTDQTLLASAGRAPLGKSLIKSAKQKGIAMAKSVKKSISFDSKFKYREIRE